ncbi:hypothetical protein N7499_007379 [Penicillium canescens]|uniref:Atg28p n=1 Tax=Penicillium canescens TaxID=5083 RepID=A0AAD6NBB3_PENCN|nr:uncharacterized protein N7446_003069 [Penicillium canescens]KAJ5996306.1 hypothetical protein N7522_007966 [Penicillium canescens]KAJ6044875.1 hypothetical protein N7460_006230 [Penicillium canescens]KAJ6056344.1 hypothetical protein N7444_005442 [Penicillium canescens]KAJ6075292.1 hypothetical protein N7446_003069 [Penicillium canescens]KAJ6082505.1 hypothetical protein N7499_007379 [Penicillium canescens]
MSTLLQQSYRDKRLPPVPAAASTYHHDPLLYIERQTKHIQRNLQVLIDAQSDGLLSGLARPRSDESYSRSLSRNTSEASRSQSPSTVPSRQPAPKKIGLRAARDGIFQSIYDLLKLREEEREIITTQTEERESALHDIESFLSKRTGLEEAIASIHGDEESQHSKQLEEEARALATDIHELETRLYEMKAKHRHLVSEISHINNSIEAKLSSYTESLSILDSDIRKYLRDPPIQPMSQRPGESTFHSLNPKRRTLDMAREHWNSEQVGLRSRQQKVDGEILALEEGGGVWKQAVTDVTGFEKRLRANMRHYVEISTPATESEGSTSTDYKDELVKNILDDLEKTTQRVESHLELAEDKDWKLLVCCIAAELEALREARGMLLSAFALPVHKEDTPLNSTGNASPKDQGQDEDHQPPYEDPLAHDDPEPPADLLKDADSHHSDTESRSEDDDEPDPAWLT